MLSVTPVVSSRPLRGGNAEFNVAGPVHRWPGLRVRSRISWTYSEKQAFQADTGEGSARDDAYCKLAHWLFAAATAMLEDAAATAVTGQSLRLDPSRLAEHGHRLWAAAQDIAIIAEAVTIAATLSANHASDRRKDRP